MNFTQSFEEFSKGLGTTTDLILYAGIALVLWILFKDKLSPVQGIVKLLSEKINKLTNSSSVSSKVSVVTEPQSVPLVNAPEVLANSLVENSLVDSNPNKEDLFFKLVVSWKETRDLALKCGCDQAVEVADTMFPYLSPNVCGKESENE
jgi:hypothetical protein